MRPLDNSYMNYTEDKSVYNSTKFMSFMDEQPKSKTKKATEKKKTITQPNNQTLFYSFEEPRFENRPIQRENSSSVQSYKISAKETTTHSEKLKLLNENQVFLETLSSIDSNPTRSTLPVKFTPEEKFSMVSMFSGVGSDLTKFTFPVTFNQPLSILQKGCEQMYYSSLLDQANEAVDSETRMLNVVAFLVSQYSLSQFRTKKPFNPLLGETFEFIDNQREFEYLGEQVSHHPPITAAHCRSNNYEIIDNSKSKTQFTGSSIKIVPESKGKLILEQFKDDYVYTKCTLAINNLLMGKIYIENYGEIVVDCKKYQTKAVIQLKEQSFWNKSQTNVVEGTIKKGDKQIFTVKGRWNEILHATDLRNNTMKVIWKKTHESEKDYFFFNDYTMQMNHLNKEKFQQIAPTDSRLRPDQRALEFQKL